MANYDAEDDFPFLELNEELPPDWTIEPPAQGSVFSAHVEGTAQARPSSPFQDPSNVYSENAPTVPPAFSRLTTASPPVTSRYRLTPTGKALLGLGAGFVLVMVMFRVPPALVLIGLFSALRVVFFPLVVGGLIWWVWRYRR